MIRIHLIIILLIAGIPVAMAPSARADDRVTYEVLTTTAMIPAVNVEYFDLSGRKAPGQVPLPWRINATVVNPRSNDAEVRADWRSVSTSQWVTVRIYFRGSLLCENTMNGGSAACYGSRSYKS
jgi:hypothetical protein